MPPLIHKFFSIPESFWKTERFLYKKFRFGPVGQKKSTKSWCPPLPMHENFRQKKFSETPNCCPMKFFGTVRQKLSDGKTWHHLSRNKFFDTPNFLKHWRDAHEIFWHCETKNFRWKNVIPPFLSSKNFSKPEIFSKTVGFRHETFRLCET